MFWKKDRTKRSGPTFAEAVYALSPDGMLMMQDGAFVACNPAAERIYGAPRDAIIGASPMDFSAKTQADGRPSTEHVGERVGEAVRDGHARFEWHNARADGSLNRILVTLIPAHVEGRDAVLVLVQDLAETAQVVDAITQGLSQVAKGNLTSRITTTFRNDYEPLRESFNNSIAAMNGTIQTVAQVAQRLRSNAAQIDATTDDLSQRTTRQGHSLRSTSEAMGRVTDMVQETARGARRVSQGIGEAERVAHQGESVVEKAVVAMQAIDHSSDEITQIISVIDGISFQTNLLALNAGVEAARAGEAGKGFAVVATEVRALAQRSAEAATNVSELLSKSSEQVKAGVSLVAETGTMLRQILERVSEINTMAGAISESADTQAGEVNQIKEAIADMDRMLTQSGSIVSDSTNTARELAREAEELTHLVSSFETGNALQAPTLSGIRRAA